MKIPVQVRERLKGDYFNQWQNVLGFQDDSCYYFLFTPQSSINKAAFSPASAKTCKYVTVLVTRNLQDLDLRSQRK